MARRTYGCTNCHRFSSSSVRVLARTCHVWFALAMRWPWNCSFTTRKRTRNSPSSGPISWSCSGAPKLSMKVTTSSGLGAGTTSGSGLRSALGGSSLRELFVSSSLILLQVIFKIDPK
uniref:(northern house mosquito) hypothetical protein n=1 Tax=Culex pipiens TaxID=7175 RepID=A0A8D8FQ94_CULPI